MHRSNVSLAGAGAYYFAKQEINADRKSKLEQMRQKRMANHEMEFGSDTEKQPSTSTAADGTPLRSPSRFESTQTYKSTKGDRFS